MTMKARLTGYRHQVFRVGFWMLSGAVAYVLLKRLALFLWSGHFEWDLELISLIVIYACVLTAFAVQHRQEKAGGTKTRNKP